MLTTILISTVVLAAFAIHAKTANADPNHRHKSGHSHRFEVAHRLRQGLAGTPLATYAYKLEAEGWRRNINPFFIAAISGVESSFGAAACGGNAWGIGSCGTSFATFADGIATATRLLRDSYVSRGLRDVWSIGRVYCPPCGSRWGDQVSWFMQSRFGSGPTVTYPTN